jgi:hypothetical protein
MIGFVDQIIGSHFGEMDLVRKNLMGLILLGTLKASDFRGGGGAHYIDNLYIFWSNTSNIVSSFLPGASCVPRGSLYGGKVSGKLF